MLQWASGVAPHCLWRLVVARQAASLSNRLEAAFFRLLPLWLMFLIEFQLVACSPHTVGVFEARVLRRFLSSHVSLQFGASRCISI